MHYLLKWAIVGALPSKGIVVTPVPDPTALMSDTLEILQRGLGSSEAMREALAPRYGLSHDQDAWARFVNNHAWALVRLQSAGKIRKVATGVYALTEASPTLPQPQPSEPIREGEPLPEWAREQVRCANARNNTRNNKREWNEIPPPFTEKSLRELWQKCGGRCAMTGLPFDERQVGTGRARRPFAPSLDREDPEKPYTVENCRLVLQGVNFALNSFGDDTFLTIATAASNLQRAKKLTSTPRAAQTPA